MRAKQIANIVDSISSSGTAIRTGVGEGAIGTTTCREVEW